MKTDHFKTPIQFRFIAAVTCVAFFAGCATGPKIAGNAKEMAAFKTLASARSSNKPPEQRAALYLQAASMAAPMLGSGKQPTLARETYNEAAAELTVLLRSDPTGKLWNHPLTLTNGTATYHLQLEPARFGVWAPTYFTSFVLPSQVKQEIIKDEITQAGVGGALVGVRAVTPREDFAAKKGITAPVTATLDFKGLDAALTLRRPAKQPTAPVEGVVRPLAADYSAPIGYYRPPANLLLTDLMGTLRSSHSMDKIGLYFLQPYDPERIPLIFVHGLASSPFTWVKTINGLQADPEVRKHYQFWVFAYATGNPVLYSALRCRQELAKVDKLHPDHKDFVLVGHSMGGLVSQLQTTTVTRADWEKAIGAPAKKLFSELTPDELVAQALAFKANPRVKRVVFVCTPHRGADMASGGIGRLAISLISLPATLAKTITTEVSEDTLKQLNGGRLPNSVTNLQPTAPYIKVLDKSPVQAPYHSIIGNRGKPGPLPESTDGVVPYWSSHMDKAKSEVIVPGPHGSTGLPQTIAELDRILRLNLQTER